MAKYTELLSEYLTSGGQLPTAFDKIEGFTELFIAEYIDREIGYETPTIFEIKLNQRAELVIPPYLARKAAIDAANEVLLNPTKKHVRSGSTERSKQGEIIHTDSKTDTTVINTKAGEISHSQDKTDTTVINTKAGEKLNSTTGTDTTNTGAPSGATGIGAQITKTWDLPTAAVISGGGGTGVDPSTVEENSPTKSTVEHGTTVTESYNEYEDKTHTTAEPTKTTESYKDYEDKTHTTAEPTKTTESYNEYADVEKYNDITDTETGLTSSEALAIKQEYEMQVSNLMQELLTQFDSCFMQVF